MEAQFKSGSDGSETVVENIQICSESRKYQLFGERKLPPFEKLKYPILIALVFIAVLLSIISLSIKPGGQMNGQQQSSQSAGQQSAQQQSVVGSMYCGGDEDYNVIMNAYTTEGLIDTPNSRQLVNITGYRQCYVKCTATYGMNCNFFSYHDKGGECTISSADFYSSWTLTESIDGAVSCYRTKPGQWKMLYRRPKLTKSGYTNEVTGPWVDNDYYTNGSLYYSDEALPNSISWSILKSQLCRYWESLNIDKVKVSLYKDGKEVHHLIFNGRGSNIESWFHMAFLLETTWKDLSPANPPMYLGWWFKDRQFTLTARSMYVASAHIGCPDDRMWMALMQNQLVEGCTWALVGEQNVPRLFYAPGEMEAGVDDLEDADYMTISVSFPMRLPQDGYFTKSDISNGHL